MKVERDEDGRPMWYRDMRGWQGKNDPFKDFLFVRGFSLPLARYAYWVADQEQKANKKKQQ